MGLRERDGFLRKSNHAHVNESIRKAPIALHFTSLATDIEVYRGTIRIPKIDRKASIH